MRLLVMAFISGLIFAVGLGIGGMTQPAKVIAFLDLFGDWDPSLAFVMGGAIAVHLGAMRLLPRLRGDQNCQPPSPRFGGIDRRLILGAVMFGLGWGLIGLCPGPAIVSLVSLDSSVLVFFAAMVTGMAVFHLGER